MAEKNANKQTHRHTHTHTHFRIYISRDYSVNVHVGTAKTGLSS